MDFFKVVRMHGTGAFEYLGIAWKEENIILALNEKIKRLGNDSWKDVTSTMDYHGYKDTQVIHLSRAVLLYQASMEAIINRAYSEKLRMKRPKSFKDKWITALEHLNQDTSYFTYYFDNFYSKYRNPLIHIGNEEDVKIIENLDFQGIYLGFKSGWKCFETLSGAIGETHFVTSPAKTSWETICLPHQIPSDLYLSQE